MASFPLPDAAPNSHPDGDSLAAGDPPLSGTKQFELKRWDNAEILWCGGAVDVREALVKATVAGVSLAFVDLTGADLEAIDLPARADLQNACLKKTRFSKSRFQQVNFLKAILDDGSTVIAPYPHGYLKADIIAFFTNRGVRYKGKDFFGEKYGLRKKLEKDRPDAAESEKQIKWIEACEERGRAARVEYAVKAIEENGATLNFGVLSDPSKQAGDCIDLEAEITVNNISFACCGGQVTKGTSGGEDGKKTVGFMPAISPEIGKLFQHFALDRNHGETMNAIHEAVLKACQKAWDELGWERCTPLQAALCSAEDIRKAISSAVRAGRWDDYLFWFEVAAVRPETKPKPNAAAWKLKIEADGNFAIESGDNLVCEYRNPAPDTTDWIGNAILLHSSPRVLQQLEYLLDRYIDAVHLLNAVQRTPLSQEQLEAMSETQQILAQARGEIR